MGPSINDVTPRGKGGGYPQKVTRGDRGRGPVFSRGDITPNLPFLREPLFAIYRINKTENAIFTPTLPGLHISPTSEKYREQNKNWG